jgi:hypothetical protein
MKESQELKGLPTFELQVIEINQECMNTDNTWEFFD